jgi:site-specific DNA recombinase
MRSVQEEIVSTQKAVIYCRVSSAAQTKRGDGLGSQETRCREYARMKGYEVVARFDDDLTGKLVERPGMKSMLSFLRKHRTDNCMVLIDDISRLARDVEAHWELRRTILRAGGKLESPSIEFKQDADSRMVENVLAGAAQHQREKNAEQTYHRMRARLMNGYWVFWKVKGYKYEKTKNHGKMLIRDEPMASIIQEALEGFASGRFDSQVEVKRFLESQPEFPSDFANGEIRNQRVTDILTQPLYAGYLQAPNWDIPLRQAQHTGLISFTAFEKIQQRLKEGAKAPARKDISEDFPLRGFVTCGDCDRPLTACWSRSKTGKSHAYYLCFKKGCISYRKSIPRDTMEQEFEAILQSMQPAKNTFALIRTMFKNAWAQTLAHSKDAAASIKQDISKTENQIEQLVDRIVETDNTSIMAAFEKKITKLEKHKLLLQENLQNSGKPRHTFEQMFELAMQFLSNPWNLWVSGQIHLRKTVLRLAFSERMAYQRGEGFRTPQVSIPFRFFGDSGCKNEVARHEGETSNAPAREERAGRSGRAVAGMSEANLP